MKVVDVKYSSEILPFHTMLYSYINFINSGGGGGGGVVFKVPYNFLEKLLKK